MAHFLGVVQLIRDLFSIDQSFVWILCMCFIDECQSRVIRSWHCVCFVLMKFEVQPTRAVKASDETVSNWLLIRQSSSFIFLFWNNHNGLFFKHSNSPKNGSKSIYCHTDSITNTLSPTQLSTKSPSNSPLLTGTSYNSAFPQ